MSLLDELIEAVNRGCTVQVRPFPNNLDLYGCNAWWYDLEGVWFNDVFLRWVGDFHLREELLEDIDRNCTFEVL